MSGELQTVTTEEVGDAAPVVEAPVAPVVRLPTTRGSDALPALPALRLNGIGETVARFGDSMTELRMLFQRVEDEHAGLTEDLRTVEDRLRQHREDLRFQLEGGNKS